MGLTKWDSSKHSNSNWNNFRKSQNFYFSVTLYVKANLEEMDFAVTKTVTFQSPRKENK